MRKLEFREEVERLVNVILLIIEVLILGIVFFFWFLRIIKLFYFLSFFFRVD